MKNNARPERTFNVSVQNGSAPLTVIDVGLLAENEKNSRLSTTRERFHDRKVSGPNLPCRLGGNDFEEWGLAVTHDKDFSKVPTVRGYIEIGGLGSSWWRRMIKPLDGRGNQFRRVVSINPEFNASDMN